MHDSTTIIRCALIGFADPDDANLVTNGDGYVSWYDDEDFAYQVYQWARTHSDTPLHLVAGMSITLDAARKGREALAGLGLAPTPAPTPTPKPRASTPRKAARRGRKTSPVDVPAGMVSVAELKRAVQLVRKVAPVNTSNAALSGVRITGLGKEDAGFTLRCTDSETWLTHPMNGHFDGDVVVEARALADTVKALGKGAHVKLEHVGSKLHLVAGNVTRTLTALCKVDDFPAEPDVDLTRETLILGEGFGPALRSVARAASKDDNRYGLCGVHVEYHDSDGGMRLVATDGSRLHWQNVGDNDPHMPPKMMVPTSALGKVVALVHPAPSKPGHETLFSVGDTHVRFRTDRAAMLVRLVDGEFPDYRQVIPSGLERTVHVPHARLVEALKGILPVAKDRNSTIVVDVGHMELTLSCKDCDGNETRLMLPCNHVDTRHFKVGLNASYLLDAVLHAGHDCMEEVELRFSEYAAGEVMYEGTKANGGEVKPLAPVLVGTPDRCAIAMPIRLD